jgi:hypothetical protein
MAETFVKRSTTLVDRNEECACCGRMLRERAHFWAGDKGNYCRRRCAAAHDEAMAEAEAEAQRALLAARCPDCEAWLTDETERDGMPSYCDVCDREVAERS